jgi:peptidoglycan/LPS O-acetylase OafA/YrhL
VFLGGILPVAALSRLAGTGTTIAYTGAVFLMVLLGSRAANPNVQRATGVAGGVYALVLVMANGRIGPWEGLIILAVMFLGTVIYRADQGQLDRRRAAVVAATVLCVAAVTGVWHLRNLSGDTIAFQRNWAITVLLTGLVFGAAYAVRHRRPPRWLTWLGVISYSVYLLHPLLLVVIELFVTRRVARPFAVLLPYLVALLALSALTHRFIELPAQRLGRRLSRPASPVALDELVPALRSVS